MFIKKIEINNFRKFEKNFVVNNINVPDKANEGSGLTVLLGENGCGKTTVLDAISFCISEYKPDIFDIKDMNTCNKDTNLCVLSDNTFDVKTVYGNSSFKSIGYNFRANLRQKKTSIMFNSQMVKYQEYIAENAEKYKQCSPDVRTNITNVYGSKRNNDTDLLYLEKNRVYQIKGGLYNDTKFDRIMNDFNYQYNKNSEIIEDINFELSEKLKKGKIHNETLNKIMKVFNDITDIRVELDFLDNYKPFDSAKFAVKKNDNILIDLASLGSGFEMIFSLIYSCNISLANDKNLIIMIDEPELHMHPTLQKRFVDYLLDISKNVQIILTSHSPILVKQLLKNKYVKLKIINKDNCIDEIAERKLSYLSANEINYLAFNYSSIEYYNELYEELMFINEIEGIRRFDNEFFVQKCKLKTDYPEKGKENRVTKYTYIRNAIHHSGSYDEITDEELNAAIIYLRSCFQQ